MGYGGMRIVYSLVKVRSKLTHYVSKSEESHKRRRSSRGKLIWDE